MNSRFLVTVFCLLVTACGTVTMVKPNGTESERNADKAQCEYEALKAVQTPDNSYYAPELDMAMRRLEVENACMKTKGYVKQIT